MGHGRIESRLRELGIELPRPSTPVANYVPFVRTGTLVHIAGQLPRWNDELQSAGKLGRDLDVRQGRQAARICALNLIGHLRAALGGDLDSVTRCVRVGGFVNSESEFHDHPAVMDGASDLLVEVFGEAGRHVRTAVGVAALPANASVEVEATFEIG